MTTPRRQQLLEFLNQNPNDAFARYGLAMDFMSTNERDSALEQFQILRQQHPDYPAGFHQAGQLLIAMQRPGEARPILVQGLTAADRARDPHAREEMQGLLDEIADL